MEQKSHKCTPALLSLPFSFAIHYQVIHNQRTMARRLRSSGTSSSSRCDPFQRELAKKQRKAPLEGITAGAISEDEIAGLLVQVLSSLKEGYWWKILPDNNNQEDICMGSGQE